MRVAAAGAAVEAALAVVASVHGRLLGLRPELYLVGAALWLALALWGWERP